MLMLQLTTGTLSYLRDHEVSTTVFATINWVSGYDFCIFCWFPLQLSNDEKVFKHRNVNQWCCQNIVYERNNGNYQFKQHSSYQLMTLTTVGWHDLGFHITYQLLNLQVELTWIWMLKEKMDMLLKNNCTNHGGFVGLCEHRILLFEFTSDW